MFSRTQKKTWKLTHDTFQRRRYLDKFLTFSAVTTPTLAVLAFLALLLLLYDVADFLAGLSFLLMGVLTFSTFVFWGIGAKRKGREAAAARRESARDQAPGLSKRRKGAPSSSVQGKLSRVARLSDVG